MNRPVLVICRECWRLESTGPDGLCDRCAYTCKDCGNNSAVRGRVCGDCDYRSDMSDHMEARGECYEPSVRNPQVRGDQYGAERGDWLDEDVLERFAHEED